MRRFRKWVLTLTIIGVTPSLALAGLPSFLHMGSSKSRMQATARKNQQIAEEIASALRAAQLTGYDIQIQYERGVATLTGQIPNADQKSRVGDVVSKIHGVKRVDNQIVARSSRSSSPSTTQTSPASTTQTSPAPTTQTKPKTPRSRSVPKPFTGIRNFSSLFKKPAANPSKPSVSQPPRKNKLEQTSLERPSAAKQPNNQKLATQIASALRNARLTSTGIDIEVRNGTVTLTGNTVDAEQKAKVTRIVSNFPGVRTVNNQLVVIDHNKASTDHGTKKPVQALAKRKPASPLTIPQRPSVLASRRVPALPPKTMPALKALDNQDLAARVASALRNARLTNTGLDIEVRHGTVTLTGDAINAEQKAKASQIVSRLPGVRTVNNQLVVVDDRGALSGHHELKPRATNQQIAERIAAALKESGLVGHGIEIQFKDGVATLAGQIASQEHEEEALRRVAQVPGVKTVKNTFTVVNAGPAQAGSRTEVSRQAAPENPQAVAQQIAQTMESTQLRGHDITVRYQNGKAILLGSVSSPEQLPYATQLAMSVPAVKMVDNRLTVPGTPTVAPGDPFANSQAKAANRSSSPRKRILSSILPVGVPMSASATPVVPRKADSVPTTLVSTQVPPQSTIPPNYGHPGSGASHAVYNMPHLPATAWPAYASYPNYAQVTYPKEYSASAWPYIGPFYPYPQIPLGWRKVQLEWDDGYWNVNFHPRTGKWWWFLNPENW